MWVQRTAHWARQRKDLIMAGDRSTQTTNAVREFCTAPCPTLRRVGSTATEVRQAGGQKQSDGVRPHYSAGEGELAAQSVRPRLTLKKPAEYRKALVSGIGAITVVLVSLTEPLGGLLGATMTHWMAAGVAATTALATYFTKNAISPAVPEPPPQAVHALSAQSVPEPQSAGAPAHNGVAIAGLALIVGGAVLAGRHTERHRRCVSRFALLPPGSFSVGQ